MATTQPEKAEIVSSAVPPKVKVAITKAIAKGLAVTESDYIRNALVKKLKDDELL